MTDPLEALAAADPLRDTAPTAAEAARMDAALHRLLAAEPASAAPVPPREVGVAQDHVGPRGPAGRARRRPRRAFVLSRRLAIPAGAVAAAVVALAAPDRAPTPIRPAPATAATLLTELGRKVAAAPAQQGRYAYQRTLSYVSHMRPKPGGKGTYVVVVPHVDEQWIAGDGTGIARSRMEYDRATFPTSEDRADYEAAGPGPDMSRFEEPRRIDDPTILGMSPAAVKALPTDPVALKAAIAVPDVQETAVIGQLLASALTPGPVKVALFEVLKGLPGATLVKDVTDPQGRTGVGVRFQTEAWDTLFAFDPRTGQLLGTRSIGHKEVEGRDISDWSLVLESGRRDDAPTPTARTLTKPVA
jgi:hypothetical protein